MGWPALAVLLVAYGWALRRDPVGSTRFAHLPPARRRIARYRRWLARAALGWGGSSAIALTLLGGWSGLLAVQPDLAPVAALLAPHLPAESLWQAAGWGIVGAIGGGLLLTLATRRRGPERQVMLGDVGPLMPRRRAELGWAALLCLNAGLVEELYFRLALPLALAAVTGNALLAVIAATLLFGLAHRYQRWVGVLATAASGTVLAVLYLGTGSLLLAMGVHAATNAVGLVLRPAVAGAWRATA